MAIPKWVVAALLIALTLPVVGCARTARDTTGFALSQSGTVNLPYEEAWQTVKAVLREREDPGKFDIYTRDKRGIFVANENTGRRALFIPSRVVYTIAVEPAGENVSQITVETVKQVYGVTLLTYPGWHDRPMKDPVKAQQMLQSIHEKATGGSSSPQQ